MTSKHLSYNEEENVLHVPDVRGVEYLIDGKPVTGDVRVYEPTIVEAKPKTGFRFPDDVETRWTYGEAREPLEELRSVQEPGDSEADVDPTKDDTNR